VSVRRIGPDNPEARAVAAMVDGTFDYYGEPYWEWKYADPGGPDALIMIADEEGDVVGCNHYLVMPYQLGGERTLTGVAAADQYVNPDLRRRHIASDLTLESRMVISETRPDADFVVMFTWQELGTHYEKLLGYTKLKPGYRQWSKRLAWKPQLERLAEANAALVARHPNLARVSHQLRIEVKGSPPLDLEVGPEGFTPGTSDDLPRPRLRVAGPDALSFGRSKLPLFWAIAAIVTGRWRLWGSARAIRQAISVVAAYRYALQALKRS
jgi:hypothetical protein